MIEVTRGKQSALLTLTRPEKRNALNIELCHQLRDAVRQAVDEGVRALVLTGAGTSFCSGADLDGVYSAEFRDALYEMLHTIVDAPVAVVAAVNGPAIGAGTQLAIAADLRVVAPSAVFGIPTAKLGLAVDPWTIRRFALLAGPSTARSVVMACSQLSADAALACGLAQRAGSLDEAVAWAEEIAALAPLTVAYSKLALNGEAGEVELAAAFEACWASADFAEGRLARTEKRPPRFVGR